MSSDTYRLLVGQLGWTTARWTRWLQTVLEQQLFGAPGRGISNRATGVGAMKAAVMGNGTIIDLRAVRRRFGDGPTALEVLKGIDLVVPEGQFVVVLGPSGSGKTTMLNIVGGIETATSGTVSVAGRELGALDGDGLAEFRRTTVGFIFQFFNLVPTLTARENVALIAELVGRVDQSAALLEAVGLGHRLDHFPSALSGGEQQRVAVARALAKDPHLLLCDEPTGALDLETGQRVLALLRHVNRAEGRTVVVVTHNQVIARMADRVLRLHGGEIKEDVTVADPTEAQALQW